MNELSKLHGYHIGKNKRVIHCTRIGDTSRQRNYAGGALAAKCPFQVKLKPLCRIAYKAKETSKGWMYRDLWNEPVLIISACCQHGGMCHPSRQNRVMTGQRSGKYVAQIPDNALFTLCNQYEKRSRLASAFIKDTLLRRGSPQPFFQSWHFFRACVTGSLDGWSASIDQVDNIIGYQPEALQEGEAGMNDIDAHNDGVANGILGEENTAALPPGYLPDCAGGSIKPLSQKNMQNILENVCAGYSRCSEERKFAVYELAMQLQNLMVCDESQCNAVTSAKCGLSVLVPKPNAHSVMSQPHNRLAPRHEIAANKAANKKTKFSVEVEPGGQRVIHRSGEDILVNTKPTQKDHCAFCNGNHKYPSCGNRCTLKTGATEFMLLSDTPTVLQSLRARLQYSMPYITWSRQSTALTTTPSTSCWYRVGC